MTKHEKEMAELKTRYDKAQADRNKPEVASVENTKEIQKEDDVAEFYLKYFEDFCALRKIKILGAEHNRLETASKIKDFIASNKLTEDKYKSYIKYCAITHPRYGAITGVKMYPTYLDKNSGKSSYNNNYNKANRSNASTMEAGPMMGTIRGSKAYWDSFWEHYDTYGLPKTQEAAEYEKSQGKFTGMTQPSKVTLESVKQSIKEAF